MPFIWNALPPETNVGNLLGGPGVAPIVAAAESYLVSAMALKEAAGLTEAAMGDMGETWRGPSGAKAQSAFRNHTDWLHQQSVVAQEASAVLQSVAGEFTSAQSAMAAVGGWLAKNRLEQAVLLLTNGSGQNGIPLILNQIEYVLIWGAAAGVMDGYAGAVLPTLSALPPPALPTPIVADPGVSPPPPTFDVPVYNTKSGQIQSFDNSTTNTNTDTTTNNNTNTDTGNSKTGDTNTGDTNTGNTDTNNTPTDASQSQTQPATTDPSDVTSPLDSSGMNAGDGTSADQSGAYGTSPNSSTLAGLNGGVGSLVALNMARGGLGSMPGASTGFRMPSNWLRGPGTAFGPSSNPVAAGPGGRGATRRGAIAPKAQMRRRRDEERKPGKVFVPGEELEVPVLEKPPVIGVIEYADERPDDAALEGELLVGVLERSDDDVAATEPEPAR